MASSTKFRWFGKKVEAELQKKLNRRLLAVGEMLASAVRENISTPNPPRSRPGEYPHAETGHLRKSITHELDEANNEVRVGTNVPYGRYLEEGTEHIAERKLLVATLEDRLSIVRRMLTKPLK